MPLIKELTTALIKEQYFHEEVQLTVLELPP